MNRSTIVATKYIDNQLTVLAECYQADSGKNDWFRFNDVQTWADWSQDWYEFLDCNVAAYGLKMYQLLSRCVIEPLHGLPAKPILDRADVDWRKVGDVIRSHFGT